MISRFDLATFVSSPSLVSENIQPCFPAPDAALSPACDVWSLGLLASWFASVPMGSRVTESEMGRLVAEDAKRAPKAYKCFAVKRIINLTSRVLSNGK